MQLKEFAFPLFVVCLYFISIIKAYDCGLIDGKKSIKKKSKKK